MKKFMVVIFIFYYSCFVYGKGQDLITLYNQGNYKDAYEGFYEKLITSDSDSREIINDLEYAYNCLRNINRVSEIDQLLEKVVKVHSKNWRLLRKTAHIYAHLSHSGYMIAGEFSRGYHRGGGRYVYSYERDRTRSLQLMNDAMNLISKETIVNDKADFYLSYANLIVNMRSVNQASWKLQYLTDLSILPDYEDVYYYSRTKGAPVDLEGNPVFYDIPVSFDDAKSDGERWIFLLDQSVKMVPTYQSTMDSRLAHFSWNQFGVQTMAYYGRFFGRYEDNTKEKKHSFSLHSLKENETIAKLATGIKRFNLPKQYDYIQLFKKSNDFQRVAEIFANRRQYKKAAVYWKKCLEQNKNYKYAKQQLSQILDNWGRFDPVMTFPNGKNASVEYTFRNGNSVKFEAFQINTKKILADVTSYFKSNPRRIDWNKASIGHIGYNFVIKGGDKYIDKKVASWKEKLQPRDNHFDKRVTIDTPLKKAGAYLLKASMKDGNVSRIIIWINDSVIVKKPLDKKVFFYVSDSVTGKPVQDATLSFFGYKQEYIKNTDYLSKLSLRRYNVLTKEAVFNVDKHGQLVVDSKSIDSHYNWLIQAKTDKGRFAYLGMTGVWYSNYYDYDYNKTKVFSITDRPVYRPSQPVKFKFWVRKAQYDMENKSFFANNKFIVEIYNPKNEKIFEKSYLSDEFGGLNGEFPIPEDATLGNYRIYIKNYGGSATFRVEEYKKPEFEVKVEASSSPVMLGDKIKVNIKANYYFGAPVTKAKVKYKVRRYNHNVNWYPHSYWDWFYGAGYWWFAYDYFWYPGFVSWGCKRPRGWWFPSRTDPPELVVENEVEIKDGKVEFELDTSFTKVIHGDKDHRYEITAEVVDQSRRTIVGSGQVLVARKPFKVYAWVNKGHYRAGDVINASFSAQTLDSKPVKGKGILNLYHLSYDKNFYPVEDLIQTWNLDTDGQGKAAMQIKASKKGQYRLSYLLTDKQNYTIEGAYVFTIIGDKLDGKDFRFNEIELIPDKKEYQAGDTVNLMVNSNNNNSTVLLFVRPANGVYIEPKFLYIKGKTHIEQIKVSKKDMPNFFVEAITINNGKIFTATKEMIVPPEKRVLNVDVIPSKNKYKPGEKASLKIKVSDYDKNPFKGSLVISVYDQSLEYISKGSNVSEIKSFFWKWRRSHNVSTETNLSRSFSNLLKDKEKRMNFLGVFGHSVADDFSAKDGLSSTFGAVKKTKGRQIRSKAMLQKSSVGSVEMMAECEDKAAPSLAKKEGRGGAPAAVSETVQPMIRKNFADTALWIGSAPTDEKGMAEVHLDMPENLTGWKIKVWSLGHGTKVGQGETTIVTKKNLMLRIQAPRFFIEKDEVVLSANIHNYLKEDKDVTAVLEVSGEIIQIINPAKTKINVKAGGEERVDWRVKVNKEGAAVIRMKALTDVESDAMEIEYPVYVHGIMKTVSFSGAIKQKENNSSINISVPEERRINESKLEIRYSPTIAAAMVDALPYLLDFPYGCTEQTLNRFIPAVITHKILLNMNLDLKQIQQKITNLNAQEIGDDKERAKQWQKFDRNPVFDEEEMNKILDQGLFEIYAMQLGDGGWGWFSGYLERSSAHITSIVVHGLQIAKESGLKVDSNVLKRGLKWLENYQKKEVKKLKNAKIDKEPYKNYADNMDAFVFMILTDANKHNKQMDEFLYRDRNHLAVYGKSMYGLALDKIGSNEKLDMILNNIEQYLVIDNENQTAYLNLKNGRYWWYWYGSEYEAQGYYLKLLSRKDPLSSKASGLAKYLINNRKHSTYWNSTRDTAICIEALAEYMKASKEDKPDLNLQVKMDGQLLKSVKIDQNNLFTFDNKIVVSGKNITSGDHKIEFVKKGNGPIYYNAYLSYFSLEDHIKKAGLEIKVNRKYYKLTKIDKKIKVAGSRGQVVDQKILKYKREEIRELSTLKSQDLVEIELIIESKNDYEYIVFEDMKPAGFEPVDVRSGYNGNDLGAYVEFRDEKVVFFVRALARGKHSVSYQMRAEIPGKFSALPTKAFAMYAPELKANSDEIKLIIED